MSKFINLFIVDIELNNVGNIVGLYIPYVMLNIKWMGSLFYFTLVQLLSTGRLIPVASLVSSVVRRSSLLSFVSRPLYTKMRRPTSGLSVNRHIWLFDPDESRQRGCKWFFSRLSFVLIRIRTHACRLLRLQKLLIHAAIDSQFFSFILQ